MKPAIGDVCLVVKTAHPPLRGRSCTVVGMNDAAPPLILQFRDGLRANGYPHNVIVLARGKQRAAA